MSRVYLPLSRRTFVKLGATTAAAAAVGCNPSPSPVDGGTPGTDAPATSDAGRDVGPARMETVTNLIIGSGFGGSITAHRLALAGHSSVILERGRRWTVTTQPDGTGWADVFSSMAPGEVDERSSWLSRNQPLPGLIGSGLPLYTGVLERIFGEGIDIVCPAGVGGGSLVYSGMMVQPPRDLWTEVMPAGLSYDDFDTNWYPLVRSTIVPAASGLPDDILALPQWTATRTFIQHAEAAGYDVQRILCGFDWEMARAEARGDIPPQLIHGSYIFGLNSGAKATLDKSYLGMAESSGMCDVRPLHWVQRIGRNGDGTYRVEVDRIDEHGVVEEAIVFTAQRLFLCAGTPNTNGLLLQAAAEGTITGLPSTLGQGFGNNGQHILSRGRVGVDTGTRQAGPACAMIFDFPNRIAMENGPAPIGGETLISTGQGIPSGRGRLVWDATAGKVTTEWTADLDMEARNAALAIIDRLNTVNGGERTTLPGLDVSITFHPLGGCVMGQTTDLFGRFPDLPGLYAIDGSLLPGCTPCSNPFWTVSANAERCIATILAEDFGGTP